MNNVVARDDAEPVAIDIQNIERVEVSNGNIQYFINFWFGEIILFPIHWKAIPGQNANANIITAAAVMSERTLTIANRNIEREEVQNGNIKYFI